MSYKINIMKKLFIVLAVGISMVCLSACGNSDKKTEEISNSIIDEKSDEKDTTKKGESDGKSDAKKINTFNISGWTEDILWGNVSSETIFLMDFNGKKVAELEKGKYFKDTYIGDYAVMKDNTIIDKSGKVVFDLEKSEFDEIIDEKCLEVGFLICAQKVNSFEETGLHYYAVNMSDGSSEEVSLKPAPCSKEWRGKYYGNGFYSQGKGAGGFDTESFLYNITTNENYPIYKMDDNGNKITEVKDIYWLRNEYSDGKFIYYVDDAKESDGLVRWKIELETGLMSFDVITDDVQQGFYPELLIDGILDMEDSDGNDTLYDVVNQIAYPMKDYASYTLIAHKDKDILITVKNEGGGVFFTVVNEKGNRVFEPIACEGGGIGYTENYIMIKNASEIDSMSFYDWEGKLLHTLKNCKEYYALGDFSIFYMKSNAKEFSIFNIEEGKEYPLNISPKSSCMGYANRHYIVKKITEETSGYESVLIDEKGELTHYE